MDGFPAAEEQVAESNPHCLTVSLVMVLGVVWVRFCYLLKSW
jgi:hypothetical protein